MCNRVNWLLWEEAMVARGTLWNPWRHGHGSYARTSTRTHAKGKCKRFFVQLFHSPSDIYFFCFKDEPLFDGIKFNFFDKAHPNRDKLMKLCQVGGGDVVRRRPPADKSGAWRDHDVEQSKINPNYPVIIITEKNQLKKKSAKGLELYQVRESKWLLDCISKCQCPRLWIIKDPH